MPSIPHRSEPQGHLTRSHDAKEAERGSPDQGKETTRYSTLLCISVRKKLWLENEEATACECHQELLAARDGGTGYEETLLVTSFEESKDNAKRYMFAES
jgi:hypothetical protein